MISTLRFCTKQDGRRTWKRPKRGLKRIAADIPLQPMFNKGLTETRKVGKLARIDNKPKSDADGAACFQRAPRGRVPERNPCRAPLQIAIHGGEPVHRCTEARQRSSLNSRVAVLRSRGEPRRVQGQSHRDLGRRQGGHCHRIEMERISTVTVRASGRTINGREA